MLKPKIFPKSLNESTLEANITAEIAELYNCSSSQLRYIYNNNLIFLGCDVLFSKHPTSRVKIVRLTPIEENRGGGWDSQIVIPLGNGEKRRVFIQFKSGTHKDWNTSTQSQFFGSEKNTNPHIEFDFNDNKQNNQHSTLQQLSVSLSQQNLPSNSVLYGFPRISSYDEFENLPEPILLRTTFLPIDTLDKEATTRGINLADSNIHQFRTDYVDESRFEIASTPFNFKRKPEEFGLLKDLLLMNAVRKWNYWIAAEELQNDDYDFAKDLIKLNLGFTLRVNVLSLGDGRNNRFTEMFYNVLSEIESNSFEGMSNINRAGAENAIKLKRQLAKGIMADVDKFESRHIDHNTDVQFHNSISNKSEIELPPNTSVTMIEF